MPSRRSGEFPAPFDPHPEFVFAGEMPDGALSIGVARAQAETEADDYKQHNKLAAEANTSAIVARCAAMMEGAITAKESEHELAGLVADVVATAFRGGYLVGSDQATIQMGRPRGSGPRGRGRSQTQTQS